MLMIDCFRSEHNKNRLISRNKYILKPLDYLGKISYSTYLYHWPVIVLIKWTVGLGSLINYSLAIVLSLSLGSLSYKYIETPFRKLTNKSLKDKFSIIFLSILSAIGLSSLVQFAYAKQNIYSLTKAAKTKDWVAWETNILEESNLPKFDFQGKSIFVIGDSHAGSYGGMNLFLKKHSNLNYRLYQIAPCNIGSINRPVDEISCKEQLDEIFKEIESNSKKGDIVFLANLRLPRYRDQWEIKARKEEELFSFFINSEDSKRLRDKGEEQLNLYIEKFSEMGLNILLDYPKPVYPSPPFRCVDPFNKDNPICKEGFSIKKETHNKLSKKIKDVIDRAANKNNVYIWDPSKILCEKNICNAERKGDYLYFDGDHISAIGNKYLYIDYATKIKQIYEENEN